MSAAEQFDATVIVVNWNTSHELGNCLASVREHSKAKLEIIVVDNASADDSCEMVKRRFPEVVLIENDDNKGFAAANNQALAIARGDHIVLLNPDIVLIESSIDIMLDWMRGHPSVGCAGCKIMIDGVTTQKTGFRHPTLWRNILLAIKLNRLTRHLPADWDPEYYRWDRESERPVDVVSGMFMVLPRRVVDVVGPMDDAYFIYVEEADLCRRVWNAGYSCWFTPVTRCIHVDGGGKSTDQVKPKMLVQIQKSKLIYAFKHQGIAAFQALRLVFAIESLMIVAADTLTLGKIVDRNRVSAARLSLGFLGSEATPRWVRSLW